MALLTFKSPVDYAAQQSTYKAHLADKMKTNIQFIGAFEDFLTTYESTASDSDAAATDALEGLNIGEDNLSDEYVMVDDAGNERNFRKPNEYRGTKKKYLNILQQVADRQVSEITIELDDLDNVGHPVHSSEPL